MRQLLAGGQLTRERHRHSLFEVEMQIHCLGAVTCLVPRGSRSWSMSAGAAGVHGRPCQLCTA